MWWGKESLQKYKRISGWEVGDGTVKCLDCGGDNMIVSICPNTKWYTEELILLHINYSIIKKRMLACKNFIDAFYITEDLLFIMKWCFVKSFLSIYWDDHVFDQNNPDIKEYILNPHEAQGQTYLIYHIEITILAVATGGGIDWKCAPKKVLV